MSPGFWAAVRRDIRKPDPDEILFFERAGSLPFLPRPGFESELWTRLQRELRMGVEQHG